MTGRASRGRQWHDALDGLTLLLVDDHLVVAEVLARCLSQLADVRSIEFAHDLGSARSHVHRSRPDVILLDCHLGTTNGLDLLEHLEAVSCDARVIVVSGSSQPSEVADAFARGVCGWVSKHGPVEDLLDAVVAMRGGQKYLAPSVVAPVMDFLIGREAPPREPTFVEELTPREREVLQCLVDGLDRHEVASRLFVSSNTVRTHVQRLLKSANVHSTVALLAAARRAGVAPVVVEQGLQIPRQLDPLRLA